MKTNFYFKVVIENLIQICYCGVGSRMRYILEVLVVFQLQSSSCNEWAQGSQGSSCNTTNLQKCSSHDPLYNFNGEICDINYYSKPISLACSLLHAPDIVTDICVLNKRIFSPLITYICSMNSKLRKEVARLC